MGQGRGAPWFFTYPKLCPGWRTKSHSHLPPPWELAWEERLVQEEEEEEEKKSGMRGVRKKKRKGLGKARRNPGVARPSFPKARWGMERSGVRCPGLPGRAPGLRRGSVWLQLPQLCGPRMWQLGVAQAPLGGEVVHSFRETHQFRLGAVRCLYRNHLAGSINTAFPACGI